MCALGEGKADLAGALLRDGGGHVDDKLGETCNNFER